MFVEIVDALRCPRDHEESWLVLAAQRTEERHVLEGTLGCPVCRAEYSIHDGIADFTDPATTRPPAAALHTPHTLPPADHLAAMLNLGDAQGFAVLTGAWGTRAAEMIETIDAPPLLLVDPPAGVVMGHGLSGFSRGASCLSRTGAARAVATGATDPARVADAARVARVGGRIVAPAESRVPDGVRELARDGTVWVGERLALPSAPVTLHVRRG